MLIYVPKITNRVDYIFNHIISNMIGLECTLTTDKPAFEAHEGAKLAYSKAPLGEAFFVGASDLLFGHGTPVLNPQIYYWDELPIFMKTDNPQSGLPFDIFAASFFLISRYEERYPSIRDEYQRYDYKESLAFKAGFLDKPLIDLWVKKFKNLLLKDFPDLNISIPKGAREKNKVLIDVVEFYAFRKKGLIRNTGGLLTDLYQLNFKRVWERVLVLLGYRKDPYKAVFEEWIKVFKGHAGKCHFFVHVGDFGIYDKPVSYLKRQFRSDVISLADYFPVDLLVSFDAAETETKIVTERKRLENIVKRNIQRTRFHFNKLNIPFIYRTLSDLEFTDDYTMGYPSANGFRASTCTPFYYYDPVYERKLPVKVHSFCMYKPPLSDFESVKRDIEAYRHKTQEVNGHFMMVVSNSLLSRSKARPEDLLEALS